MNVISYSRLLAFVALILVGPLQASSAVQQPKRKVITSVRYVRIELPGENRTLSLAEVQVMRGDRNVAPGGVASQSGTAGAALPGLAVDTNTSGNFNEGSVSATPPGKDPWWELDLGKPQGVQQITVWNRTDCCGEKLEKFTLKLLDGRRKVLFERKDLQAPRPRTDYKVTGELVSFVTGTTIEVDEVSVERRKSLQPRINSAIDRGVRYLKDAQLRDGSWGEHTPQYRAGQTALSVYTLVKCGVPRTDPSVRMGLRYLKENPPIKTYSVGITMMLYETLADEESLERLEGLLDFLVYNQIHGGINGGLWGYPSGCDLSNTQYAALGLLAAHRAGLKIAPEVFRELLDGTLRNQEVPQIVEVERKQGESGSGEIRMAGFSYRNAAVPGRATHTMTTAGISIISICRTGLESKAGAQGKSSKARAEAKAMSEAATAERLGFEWLHRNFKVTAGGKWKYYYLYGLERVGALLAVDYIGGKHWYWEGSDVLVHSQDEQGRWESPSHTCFALLFLSKATAKGASTGPLLKAPEDVRISEGEDVDIRWRVTGTNPVTMWITGFNEDLIDEFSDQEGIVQGLRITRVDYLRDGKVVKSIPVDPNKSWQGDRFPVKHEFPSAGTYRMEVLVRLVDPLAEEGDAGETEILSMPLDVFVRDQFSVAAIEASAETKAPNLLAGADVTAETSSNLDANTDVLKALDGSQGTSWLSAKGDELPTLTFEFEKAVRANTLVLSGANSSILNRNTYDRPTRIEVNINKQREPKYVEISDSVLTDWTLSFKTTRVRTLVIRILDREPGQAQAGLVGFSEVELLWDR